jgi:hypothetical protein
VFFSSPANNFQFDVLRLKTQAILSTKKVEKDAIYERTSGAFLHFTSGTSAINFGKEFN